MSSHYKTAVLGRFGRDRARHEARRRTSYLRTFALLALVVGVLVAPQIGVIPAALATGSMVLGAHAFLFPLPSVLGFMVPRTVQYITGFQGIANSATATLNIPVNRRYHSLRLWCTIAGALSDPTTVISNVQLIVNGIIMLDQTPAQLINLAKTFRVTPGTGELPIFFTEPWRNDTRTAEATSWDMFGQNTFVLRVTFLNPGGGAVGCTVSADFDLNRNVRRNPQTGATTPFLAILKRTNVTYLAPAGYGDITTLPLNYPIQRLLLSVSANTISDVLITADGQTQVFQATKAENQNLLNANLITGTFFEFPIIFDYDSKLGSNLKAQALDVRLNSTGAQTTTISLTQLVPGYV